MNLFFTKHTYAGLFRRKKVFIFVIVFAALFLIHQLIFMLLLNKSQTTNVEIGQNISNTNAHLVGDNRLRGIRPSDSSKYEPDENGMFACFKEDLKIPLSCVNDDYCDCPEDGSDEPGTNACNNGHYYCTTQIRHHTGRGEAQIVPSYKVNDGICDCCDGSDEWNGMVLDNTLTKMLQMKLHKFQAPCPNTCLRL